MTVARFDRNSASSLLICFTALGLLRRVPAASRLSKPFCTSITIKALEAIAKGLTNTSSNRVRPSDCTHNRSDGQPNQVIVSMRYMKDFDHNIRIPKMSELQALVAIADTGSFG